MDETSEERVAALVPSGHAPGSTEGLSTLVLAKEVRDVLLRPVDAENQVEIRPDGALFMPAGVVRQRLNEAVGPGRWALRPESQPRYDQETDECFYDGSLWIDGKFVARAIGGCRWRPSNKSMTKSDALEGAKSICLRRCAKDLGIGAELWTPDYQRRWKREYGIPYLGLDWQHRKKVMWRKRGQALSGDSLTSAIGICGEFPAGFGPDTPLPDGNHAGEPLRDQSDDMIVKMAEKADTPEWRLAAKAEILRRAREESAVEQADEDVTEDEVLADTEA